MSVAILAERSTQLTSILRRPTRTSNGLRLPFRERSSGVRGAWGKARQRRRSAVIAVVKGVGSLFDLLDPGTVEPCPANNPSSPIGHRGSARQQPGDPALEAGLDLPDIIRRAHQSIDQLPVLATKTFPSVLGRDTIRTASAGASAVSCE